MLDIVIVNREKKTMKNQLMIKSEWNVLWNKNYWNINIIYNYQL